MFLFCDLSLDPSFWRVRPWTSPCDGRPLGFPLAHLSPPPPPSALAWATPLVPHPPPSPWRLRWQMSYVALSWTSKDWRRKKGDRGEWGEKENHVTTTLYMSKNLTSRLNDRHDSFLTQSWIRERPEETSEAAQSWEWRERTDWSKCTKRTERRDRFWRQLHRGNVCQHSPHKNQS